MAAVSGWLERLLSGVSKHVDLYKAIRELVEERKRIDRIIASLEAMVASGRVPGQGKNEKPAGKRRGRKSMGEEERKQVSERMSRYWAAKRAEKTASTSSGGGDPSKDGSKPPF